MEVLNDFQSGTEFFFFNRIKTMGKITPEVIDNVLQIMVNDVEGDESQLDAKHAEYANEKGWL